MLQTRPPQQCISVCVTDPDVKTNQPEEGQIGIIYSDEDAYSNFMRITNPTGDTQAQVAADQEKFQNILRESVSVGVVPAIGAATGSIPKWEQKKRKRSGPLHNAAITSVYVSGVVDVLVANKKAQEDAGLAHSDFELFQAVGIIEVDLPARSNGHRLKALRAVPLPIQADPRAPPGAGRIIGVIGTCMTQTPAKSHKVRICLDSSYFASSFAFNHMFNQLREVEEAGEEEAEDE